MFLRAGENSSDNNGTRSSWAWKRKTYFHVDEIIAGINNGTDVTATARQERWERSYRDLISSPSNLVAARDFLREDRALLVRS